jgi:hypothetical protein
MDEYNFLTLLLSPDFVSRNQNQMYEPKEKNSVKVKISRDGVHDYKLYRFDMETRDFLPFFRNTRDTYQKTPKGLRVFCDYVIFAVYNSKLCILLVEMKSGSKDGARKQLDASEVFMTYIRDSAARICQQNEVIFDKDKVYIKKIVLTNKKKPPVKQTTNIQDSQLDWDAPYVYIDWRDFSLGCICKRI